MTHCTKITPSPAKSEISSAVVKEEGLSHLAVDDVISAAVDKLRRESATRARGGKEKQGYVVLHGRQTEVFPNWPAASARVTKFHGARFKGYYAMEDAIKAWSYACSHDLVGLDPPVARTPPSSPVLRPSPLSASPALPASPASPASPALPAGGGPPRCCRFRPALPALPAFPASPALPAGGGPLRYSRFRPALPASPASPALPAGGGPPRSSRFRPALPALPAFPASPALPAGGRPPRYSRFRPALPASPASPALPAGGGPPRSSRFRPCQTAETARVSPANEACYWVVTAGDHPGVYLGLTAARAAAGNHRAPVLFKDTDGEGSAAIAFTKMYMSGQVRK
ncbi:hypothetical protein D9615_010627 [Tricholomella constricta]|uniref:Ribonuclease H1 N-terminal domain-containing protein n=1 Tax=Tricholomella constricta TaxID=117010 RepID=A0A8H5LRD2_9AGAR|nr:hypothetical protein D9615_010627 [Tricholomella constricta]